MITLLIAQKSQNEEVVPKPPHKPWQVCSTHTSPLTSTLSSSWYSLPVRGRNTGTLHLTPGIIMKTWDLPRVWRYWLARGALDTVTGFRRVHCCSPRNRSLTFIAVEKNIVWFPKDWKKKKKRGGIKERNSFFFFFCFTVLLSLQLWLNTRAAVLWTRGSSWCQQGKLGWAGLLLSVLFPLSIHTCRQGVGQEAPFQPPTAAVCQGRELEEVSVELCMPASWGPHECDCKGLAVCPQTGEHAASLKCFCPW